MHGVCSITTSDRQIISEVESIMFVIRGCALSFIFEPLGIHALLFAFSH